MEDLDEAQDLLDVMEAVQVAEADGAGRGRRIFQERMDPLEHYSDDEFFARYRLSKECTVTLLEEIHHLLPDSRSNRGNMKSEWAYLISCFIISSNSVVIHMLTLKSSNYYTVLT